MEKKGFPYGAVLIVALVIGVLGGYIPLPNLPTTATPPSVFPSPTPETTPNPTELAKYTPTPESDQKKQAEDQQVVFWNVPINLWSEQNAAEFIAGSAEKIISDKTNLRILAQTNNARGLGIACGAYNHPWPDTGRMMSLSTSIWQGGVGGKIADKITINVQSAANQGIEKIDTVVDGNTTTNTRYVNNMIQGVQVSFPFGIQAVNTYYQLAQPKGASGWTALWQGAREVLGQQDKVDATNGSLATMATDLSLWDSLYRFTQGNGQPDTKIVDTLYSITLSQISAGGDMYPDIYRAINDAANGKYAPLRCDNVPGFCPPDKDGLTEIRASIKTVDGQQQLTYDETQGVIFVLPENISVTLSLNPSGRPYYLDSLNGTTVPLPSAADIISRNPANTCPPGSDNFSKLIDWSVFRPYLVESTTVAKP